MRALIIDDEADLRLTLERMLERLGWEAVGAACSREGVTLAQREPFDLILTDLRLPDGNGIDIVETLAKTRPEIPVAVITAYGDIDTAVRATKLGAVDFITKPIQRERLAKLLAAITPSQPHPTPQDGMAELIGQSPAIATVREEIARFAKSLAPVLIQGPSGSGKELTARLLHRLSPRSQGPFVAVNCGAIPAELIEAELFGVHKGAYTGAHRDRPGLIAAAEGGTLLLDEIAELPLALQPKLLRVLQERTVRPLGATAETPIDVRICAATHVDLAAAVAAGRFREDLYYRLAVLVIELPPLTAHREDIPLLAHHLIARIAERDRLPVAPLTAEAEAWLVAQPWPGNVRELENLLARALALADGAITPQLLARCHRTVQPGAQQAASPSPIPSPAPDRQPAAGEPPAAALTTNAPLTPETIQAALAACGGNQSRAAQQLGLTLSQLRYRMRKWGLLP
ncbi:two-component system response regulator PilR [Hydrogenophilus islandicus]